MLIRRRKERYPRFTVEGHPITLQKSAKYLGVHLQQELTGSTHIRKVAGKAVAAATTISKILPRTFGASEAQRRVLSMGYNQSRYTQHQYGAAEHYDSRRTGKPLNAHREYQQSELLILARAYRTTSTPALLVLARTTPWPLLIETRDEKYKRSKILDTTPDSDEKEIDEARRSWQNRIASKALGRPGPVAHHSVLFSFSTSPARYLLIKTTSCLRKRWKTNK